MLYNYKAKVISIYDGDTITAEVDLGFNVKLTEKFRLAGINAPEIRGAEREQGLISRDRLRERILDQEVIIITQKDKKGKYGRYIAEVHHVDDHLENTFINEWLVQEGLAVEKEY